MSAGDRDGWRTLAAEWHGGQWTALYAYASSGTVCAGLAAELADCMAVTVRLMDQGYDPDTYNGGELVALGEFHQWAERAEDALVEGERS